MDDAKIAARIRPLESFAAKQPGSLIGGEAGELVSEFYLEQGDGGKAEEFRKRAEELYTSARQLQEQALNVSANDRFASHDLEPNQVEEMKAQLKNVRGLGAAYLVRKLLEGPVPALYVLAVTADFTWRNGRSEKDIDSLFDELSARLQLPPPFVFLSLDGPHAYLLDHISRVAGAELFATPDHGVRHFS